MSDKTAMPAGGASSSLDLSNPRDRAALRVAMRDWPARFRAITPEKRDNWVNELEDIRSTVKNVADDPEMGTDLRLKAASEVRACVATSALLDAMQQRQELAEHSGRLKDLHHLESLEQTDRHHKESNEVKALEAANTRKVIVEYRQRALPADQDAQDAPRSTDHAGSDTPEK